MVAGLGGFGQTAYLERSIIIPLVMEGIVTFAALSYAGLGKALTFTAKAGPGYTKFSPFCGKIGLDIVGLEPSSV